MARVNQPLIAFNRGRISKYALARADLARVGLSSEIQTNWMPRVMGSMMLRPGWGYILNTRENEQAVYAPFVKSTDDVALVEFTNLKMRVIVDDAVLSRVSVSSAVVNGNFDADLSSWDDADETGAASSFQSGGYLALVGTGFNAAIRRQQVNVTAPDQSKRHALRIVIERGPVTLKVGSTAGDDDLFSEAALTEGVHSLAFTPSNVFHIELSSTALAASWVDSVQVESAGDVEMESPWLTANLSGIRWVQSGDVIFLAEGSGRQYRVERRASDSWSLVKYLSNDGPFRILNITTTTIAPSALSGDVTLTASKPTFRFNHEGALFKLRSVGQTVEADLTGDGQFTGNIRVSGVGASRAFNVIRAGTWAGNLRLQRSIAEPGSWVTVATYTNNGNDSYSDGLDNQIAFYRLAFGSGDHTSGTAEASLSYASGGLTGVARITEVTDSTTASAAVLTPFGATDPTVDWSEGSWSDLRGWPSAVTLYEGRLWWSGKDRIWGSVSDAFNSFDEDFEGDAGPLNRSVGSGPVDDIHWLLPLLRLVVGTEGSETSARSSSFDEPLTPTNFNLKDPSTQGSAAVAAVKIDLIGIFVQRSGTRVYQIAQQTETVNFDYTSDDLTAIVPEIGEPGIVKLAVQRQPDTRIHCVRSDGTVAVLVFDRAEDVVCWIDVETSGEVEDVAILPGSVEDAVYYTVKRTVNGNTVRFLEKWSLESQSRGQPEGRLADAHIVYSGAETTTIAGLGHLEGESVVVWGWNTETPFTATLPDGTVQTVGRDFGTFTVTGGQITGLSASVTNACVGLSYTGQYKSTKLAYAADRDTGTALTQTKKVSGLGFIIADTHAQGIKYGPSFGQLDDMPLIEEGAEVDQNTVWGDYDKEPVSFDGEYDADSRVCLQATAPRPAGVLALVVRMETNVR